MNTENLTPTSAESLRVYIDGLTQGPEVKHSLPVGKDVQQPEQFAVDAARRGDDRWQRPGGAGNGNSLAHMQL